jgi:hypothetical protein
MGEGKSEGTLRTFPSSFWSKTRAIDHVLGSSVRFQARLAKLLVFAIKASKHSVESRKRVDLLGSIWIVWCGDVTTMSDG